jgi:hypothetical protein
MAIHLILLSVNKLHCNLARSVEIVSNCLGALKRVSYLPPYRIPSQCHHSDILKNILVHCRDLSFTTYYSHIKAHQDNNASFDTLSQKTQLDCICNHAAKQRIAIDGIKGNTPKMFLLKPIGLFVCGEKMTSKTGGQIGFWAQHQLTRAFYHDWKILSHNQFNSVDWISVHHTLHDLPRLFQAWAAKHVLGITGTMKFLAHQDNRSPICPSSQDCKESCKHVAQCPEAGRTLAFTQSMLGVELWLDRNSTHPDFWSLLLLYL